LQVSTKAELQLAAENEGVICMRTTCNSPDASLLLTLCCCRVHDPHICQQLLTPLPQLINPEQQQQQQQKQKQQQKQQG
jgi:hypothetical protein